MPPTDISLDGTETSAAHRSHSITHERFISGALAATLVLGWYAFIDGVSTGSLWATAERVGAPLGTLITGTQESWLGMSIGIFLVLHYTWWTVAATFVLGVVHRAAQHPTILIPSLLLAIIVQLPLVGLITILGELGGGSGLWIRFGLGMLIGGVVVAWAAYRTHPELVRYELAHIEDDED